MPLKQNDMYNQKEIEKLFTVDKGLEVQAHQLFRWKSILKPEKYEKLQLHIAEENGKVMKNGYEVFRGTSIDNWVHNNLMENCKGSTYAS